jgi:hypothetical protein
MGMGECPPLKLQEKRCPEESSVAPMLSKGTLI